MRRLLDISGPLTSERIAGELRQHVFNGRVLDLGAGKGINIDVLKGYGYETYGIDTRDAFETPVRPFAALATVFELPFEQSCFTAVTESLMFSQGFELDNWLDAEYRKSLKEIRRVLVPRGIFISSWLQRSGIIRATGMGKLFSHALESGFKPLPSRDREILVFQRPLE